MEFELFFYTISKNHSFSNLIFFVDSLSLIIRSVDNQGGIVKNDSFEEFKKKSEKERKLWDS